MKQRVKKALYWALSLIMVSILGILITGKTYLFSAILHNFADIDDYKIFPSRVAAPSSQPFSWPVSAGINKKHIPKSLEEELLKDKSVAFLIIRRDTIQFEKYWDSYSDTSHSNSFSMAKTMVASMVGCAIQSGLIHSEEDRISEYLWELKTDPIAKSLTIRDFLTMSVPLKWEESYSNPFSVTTEAYYGKDLAGMLKKLHFEGEAGKFRYLSGNTLFLAELIRRVSHKSLTEYFRECLWEKIGAENPAYWSLDKENGIEKSYCCVYSNARDFAKFGKLFLDSGRVNGKQLIPESFVLKSIQPAGNLTFDGKRNDFYGYGWWVIPDYKGHFIYYARGINGQYIFCIPDLDAIVVRLGNKRGKPEGDHYKDVFVYLDGTFKFLGIQ